MKDSYFAPVKNPMTIISLFVGTVEVICTLALAALPNDLKSWIILFLILFPTANALLFYFVLVRYPQNFYGPQDFQNDHSFLRSLQRDGSMPPEKKLTEQEGLKSEAVIEGGKQLAVLAKESSPAVKTWADYLSEKEYGTAINLLEGELLKRPFEKE
ncbi:MAG: hypothetical protein ABI947_16945 [Chloroflexota bacterium]